MREERGPIDVEALRVVESVFRGRLGGVVSTVEYTPSSIDPVELHVELAVGLESEQSRFDIQWWTSHGYKYRYTEAEIEFRFGRERGRQSPHPEKHVHPPGDVSKHRTSCIRHEVPEPVTIAVIECWWDALGR
jgi:hypothetical protein